MDEIGFVYFVYKFFLYFLWDDDYGNDKYDLCISTNMICVFQLQADRM